MAWGKATESDIKKVQKFTGAMLMLIGVHQRPRQTTTFSKEQLFPWRKYL